MGLIIGKRVEVTMVGSGFVDSKEWTLKGTGELTRRMNVRTTEC